MSAPTDTAGYLLNDSQAILFLAVWIVVVLIHGFFRSMGEARQDPIRPSGPAGVLDQER